MLTSLVYLQQGNLKKSKKLMKIVITGEKKSSYFPNELSSFSRKVCLVIKLNVTKKTGLYPYPKKYSFEKASLLRVKANLSGQNF